VSLFNWKAKPKTRPSRGSVAAPDELDEAARETESAIPQGSSDEPEVSQISDEFTITPDMAMAMVKGCFSPLAKYDHPSWALTDEEASPVVPKMQAAIQAVLDRHMPQFMMQMMNKYPEMLSLTYAMVLLYYMKFKAVRLIRMEEYREEQKRLAELKKAEAQSKVERDKELIYAPEAPADDLTVSGLDLPREEPPPPI
jgi:hypothetical protein